MIKVFCMFLFQECKQFISLLPHPEKYENDESDARIFPLERARLGPVPVYASVQCQSILLFGWTVQYPDQVHIAVPIVATFFGGWSTAYTFERHDVSR